MKRLTALLLLALLTYGTRSQNLNPNVTYIGPDGTMIDGVRCATVDDAPASIPRRPDDIKRWLEENYDRISGLVYVPVAFHVITALNGQGDVPDEQIQEQIDTLNSGFAGRGFAFFLASVDRTANDSWFYNTLSFDTQMKAALAIDPPHYFNLYTANIGGGILGYAYLPWQFPESDTRHGIVVLYSSLPGGTAFPYNEGKTATHETGHYLGLYHTFENGCSPPGDEVEDTPDEASPAFGCPIGRNTCPGPGVDPIHNFMDYTDDACMYEFTQGQADRMDWAVTTYKPGLLEAAPVPVAPTDLTAYSDYLSPTSIALSWTDPSRLVTGDTLLVGFFHVFIERDGVPIDSVESGIMEYLDTGLSEGQSYTYELYARIDTSVLSGNRASVIGIAGGSRIPGAPESFTLAGNEQEVTLRWTNPSGNSDGSPMIDFAGIHLYQDGEQVATYARTSADTSTADSAVHSPSVPGRYSWYLTAFDSEVPPNESAPTAVLMTPLALPVADQFGSVGLPDPTMWRTGNTDVNDRSNNPPSAPYALNLNGMPAGADTAELLPVDLASAQDSGIVFAYYYQPQGNGNNPEISDSLRVSFKNDQGEWIRVRAYPGSALQPFQLEIIELVTAPNGGGSFFHSQFQARFSSTGNPGITPFDDWFVDNVYLGPPAPVIAASQDTVVFDTTMVGSSSSATLSIHNVGLVDLVVSSMTLPDLSVFAVDTSSFTVPAGESFTVNLSFSPGQIGVSQENLTIVSNDPITDTLTVVLWGVGDVPVGTPNAKGIPKVFSVGQNYPNPFNPATTISYDIPRESRVDLVIYDLLGGKVKSLVGETQGSGSYEVQWDGTNDSGAPVTSGVYLSRFTAGNYQMVRKMLLVR